jgi:DNA-binding transcriptional MerR regulator
MTPTIQQHLLDKLRLSVGDAARVTGVSVRQLSYWTRKGLVKALGTPGRKRYDMRALERIALIKSHLTEGYGLEEAARMTEQTLGRQPLRPMRRRIAQARIANGR